MSVLASAVWFRTVVRGHANIGYLHRKDLRLSIHPCSYYSTKKSIRIGCGSGFWGDTPTAVPQLVRRGHLDFLVLDYLSEVTMSLLVATKKKLPDLGWCPDFAQDVGPHLADIKKNGMRVVTNAGGVNPAACMKTMISLADKVGADLKIAVVTGDDVISNQQTITKDQCPNPETIASANAYLG